jgi:glutamyl/glutaminyl-tRNA synthetase
VPLIVGMDRARLSKRHGATRTEAYRDEGYLPEAMVNFLALIGWAPKDNHELFESSTQLIEYFNPRDIVKSAGAFNTEKLDHFNGLYIRNMSSDEFLAALRPFIPPKWLERGEDYVKSVVVLYQEKLVKLSEIAENAWYFFEEPVDHSLRASAQRPGAGSDEVLAVAPTGSDMDGSAGGSDGPSDAQQSEEHHFGYNPASVDKLLLNNADAPKVLGELYARFEALPDWTPEALEQCVDAFCEETGLGKGKVMQPWRVALTGDKVSPGFYDLLAVLGKETTLRRAKPWVEQLSS